MFNFLKHITVEPSFFIFLVVFDWMKGLDMNLFLQKVCRFNQTSEPDLNTRCDDEKRGVLFVSEVCLKYQSTVVLLCMLVTIFSTSWSDKVGRRRRPLIYVPIIGQILHTTSGCLHSYFWHWPSISAVLSWMPFESMTGGVYLMIVACQLYVCDICNADNRTMRLGLLGALDAISLIFGRGGSGFILHNFGFLRSYLICLIFSISGLIFALIFIKDTSVSVEGSVSIYQIVNVKRMFADNFSVVFHKKLARKRLIVVLLMIANVSVIFTIFGELSVFYPYLRYRFGWNEQTYSGFVLYKFSGSALGILFCSIILSKRFKVHDGLIGLMAGSFDLIAITVLLFADQVWQLYMIPFLDVFHGTAMTVGVSMMSKYYDASELGRMNAVYGMFMLIIPLSYPAYNTIFQTTLDSFPSAFCLLSVVIDVCIISCFCGAYFLSKKFNNEKLTTLTKFRENLLSISS